MEQKQHEWMQAVTEALSDLLAARVAQATLLEAMLVSHPDPVMLRKAWVSSVTGVCPLPAAGLASPAGGAAGALSCACAPNAVASTQAMVVYRMAGTGVRRRRRLAGWPLW